MLAWLLLVGCHKEEVDLENRPNPDGSVGFILKAAGAQTEKEEAQTKGTPQNSLAQYDSVCVNVYAHTSDYAATSGNDVQFLREVNLKQDGLNWKYTPSLFWPVGKLLSFVAYASDIAFADAGISFSPAEGAPKTIHYKVPEDVTKQPDLFVSTKFDQSQVHNVSLTMKHALACVSFVGVAPQKGTYVKSITLRNVYSEGSLVLDASSIAWEVNPDSKELTVLEPGIRDDQELKKDPPQDNEYLMTADGYLMMIPQELSNAAIDVLYWNGTDDTEDNVMTYILPVDNEAYATWKPGLRYIYKFSDQSEEDITVVYYERYADGKYGLYYYDKEDALQSSLVDTKEIAEAGYGVMTKESIGQVAPIRLITYASDAVTSGAVVEFPETDSFLYPVSQSGGSTFVLPTSATPVSVFFNNSDRSCGAIVPNFAKGVYPDKTPVTAHAIRTPQQMRNITALSVSSIPKSHTYTQELELDFSKSAIGGINLTTPVVNRTFNDRYNGKNNKIKNVQIHATTVNGGLFLSNSGEINEVVLVNSSIVSSGNCGGIVANNEAGGVITWPRIIGENESDKKFTIQGSKYTGAIVGLNYGEIRGNINPEPLTELPVAEVSGWVSIKGIDQPVGGIAGENLGTITTCLVNSVYVTNVVNRSKITIEGGDYVGGIVGVNRATVNGNYSGSGASIQAEPDVAGFVSISGGNFIGGIAGQNSDGGVLNQVNIRLGRGDATDAMTITGKSSVGGIVGYNKGGTLKADGNSNSFISVRGNVIITGELNVGGIVGNNESGNISNCFVYNFYSQNTTPLVHYAPKIHGILKVGGVAGHSGAGTIKQCAVFSTVSNGNGGGDNVTNAAAEITATESSAGGIVGHGSRGLTITQSFVLGNVKIKAMEKNSGGFVGENDPETAITSVHIGNNGPEVADVYTKLFGKVKLPVTDIRMKTNGGVMIHTSGTPTITGPKYVGGVCGVNWGTVNGVSLKDNVQIGTLSSSEFVGGIAGGNGLDATVSNCKAYNPAAGTAVVIEGAAQVGGIVGVNNGMIVSCQLGQSGAGSTLITVKGTSGVGGIAGTNGGNSKYAFGTIVGTGNDNTSITNCNVYGKVLIEAIGMGDRVGGILGENGPTNKVTNSNVIGYTSNSATKVYDVTVKGVGPVGGIAGVNYGEIQGTSSVYSKVSHTAVLASNGYGGGLVGTIKSNKNKPFEAKLFYCDVSQGVLASAWNPFAGAFAGQVEGTDATNTNPTLFGTSPTGANNKIYTGTANPVLVSMSFTPVVVQSPIEQLDFPVAAPPSKGNLWADYQLWNYLYWVEYK